MIHQTQKSQNKPGILRSPELVTDSVKKQLLDIPASVTRSMWADFFKASARQTLPEQFFGKSNEKNQKSSSTAGTLQEGEEISLARRDETEVVRTPNHMEYFRTIQTAETVRAQKESVETREQVEMLQMEIKKLIKISKEMETAFKQVANQVTVDQAPGEMGKYHISFLEWVLIVVRNARMRVEEGQSWLAMFASKKAQKQYWSQFKSKGTSFGLSSERTTATQTG